MSRTNALKDYQRGYNTCKYDIEYGGREFAVYEYMYGLNEVTYAYAKGYRDRLHKTKPKR